MMMFIVVLLIFTGISLFAWGLTSSNDLSMLFIIPGAVVFFSGLIGLGLLENETNRECKPQGGTLLKTPTKTVCGKIELIDTRQKQ